MAELPPEQRAVLVELIASGKKIEAIKLLREQTGLGLKEAKDEIDALERSMSTSAPGNIAPPGGIDSSLAGPARLSRENLTALSELIIRKRKLEAIKRYREWSRADLKEARNQIEALETALRIKAPEKFASAERKGCLAAILALCIVTAIRWIEQGIGQ